MPAGHRRFWRGIAGQGLDTGRMFWSLWQDAFPDNRCTINVAVAEGNEAVQESVFTGTHTETFHVPGSPDIPATGKSEAEAKVAQEQAVAIARALHEDEVHRHADLEEVAEEEAEAVPWSRQAASGGAHNLTSATCLTRKTPHDQGLSQMDLR
jgi:SnoaL-like polyketide cyclase